MKIKILSLDRNIEKQELEQLFAAHGEVKSCEIILDRETGKSKGFAFVEMANDAEGKVAIASIHGTKVGKDKIRVKAG